jgi:hypothetical protein
LTYEKSVGRLLNAFLLPFAALLLGACGLEDYPYIFPIPQGIIFRSMNDFSRVPIPTDNAGNPYFRNFVIFYRIYISNLLLSDTASPDVFLGINPALSANYIEFERFIDSDTLINVNMDRVFQGRRYKYLSLLTLPADLNINNELSSSILGHTLEFDFSTDAVNQWGAPVMQVYAGGILLRTRILWRSADGFSPQPAGNRNFFNRDELWDSGFLNDQFNADVQGHPAHNPGISTYTYAAMYIMAMGYDSNHSPIYSTPSRIHVFLLPNPW